MADLSTLSSRVRTALDNLLGRSAKSTDVLTALEDARAMERSALSEVTAAQADHAEAIRTFDRDRGLAALAREQSATFDLSAARDAVARLEAEESSARSREADAERRRRYDAAKTKLAQSEKLIRKSYPETARAIVSIIRSVAESGLLVEEINADLPEGAERLKSLDERLLRSTIEREDLETTIVDLWVGTYDGVPVPENRIAEVEDLGNGRGSLPSLDPRDDAKSVRQKKFRRTKYLPRVTDQFYDGFASRIALPGMAYEPPHWTPSHDDSPTFVLQHLSAVEEYARNHHYARAPQIETVPLPSED